ncbi:MAG: hypothetical protein KF802_11340 [Bdellovibrionaceae bacterium]|nr:hypothetical protein [Pseudobdellovibrionaceae bacterium]
MISLRWATLVLAGFQLLACSGGGGGGGGSSARGVATGAFSIPAASCGTGVCISSLSPMSDLAAMNMSSQEAALEFASTVYDVFKSQTIPDINAKLYEIEQAFKNEGYTTCAQAVVIPPVSSYPLGGGYTVDVANGDRNFPTGMSLHGQADRKFTLALNSTKFAEIQLKCSGSDRAIYVRVVPAAGTAYEFFAEETGSAKTIYGASDVGSEKRTVYFKSSSASVFQLTMVGIGVDAGVPINVAVSGGANLAGTGKLDAQLTLNNQSLVVPATSESFVANLPNWDFLTPDSVRHCYTSFSPITIVTDASCSSLQAAVPAHPLRGGTADWSISDMQSASVSTSF